MKVAIPTTSNSWDAPLSESFEHAPSFFIVDDRRAHVQVIDNPTLHSTDNVESRIATLLADAGVQIVIATQCGDSGAQALTDACIRLISDVQGTVDLVYRRFYHGLLGNPCAPTTEEF